MPFLHAQLLFIDDMVEELLSPFRMFNSALLGLMTVCKDEKAEKPDHECGEYRDFERALLESAGDFFKQKGEFLLVQDKHIPSPHVYTRLYNNCTLARS